MTLANDEFVFSDELPLIDDDCPEQLDFWKILIVDDDQDVHLATKHALQNTDLIGKVPLFLNAYSTADCLKLLSEHSDIAVILLDVVMEAEDSGLQLVGIIRNQLNLKFPRIILRTGQPGYAPELDAVRDYDINDYKTKTELTRNKLFITVLSAIRSYDQLNRMESSRVGLEQIVHGSRELIAETGLQHFASGVIRQLAAILGVNPEGLLCAQSTLNESSAAPDYVIIAAAGRFQSLIQRRLNEIDDSIIRDGLAHCLTHHEHLFAKEYLVLYFPIRDNKHFAVFVKSNKSPNHLNQELLKVFCSNVSVCAENIHLIARLKDFAYFDRLVNLPNRTAFIEAINDCFKSGEADEYCVMQIDIDQFAEINNAFGYNYGDRLLEALAYRLHDNFGKQCLIARISGDAFGMLGKTIDLQTHLIRPCFEKNFRIEDMNHVVPISTGIVHLRDSNPDGQSVLKNASIARKLAKESGLNSDAYYTNDIGFKAKERTHLLHKLLIDFEQGLLCPLFQPQINMYTKRVIGCEALMRWRTKEGEFISPDRFIPLAEKSGLIVPMGLWILRESIKLAQQLEAEGWEDITVSINVSVVQFRMPNFLASVRQCLEESAVNPRLIELEITESVAMMDQSLVEHTLREIRALGISIAIDDFGTGFSCLSYLESLPVDRVKIDRSFIMTISNDNDEARIADLVIRLSKSLDIRVIAEGVENEFQANRLLSLGCQEAQGYLYAKPMTATDLKSWLQTWVHSHPS